VAKAVQAADDDGNRPAPGDAGFGAESPAVVSIEQVATPVRAGRDSQSGSGCSPDTGRIGDAWSADVPVSDPPTFSRDEPSKDVPARGPAYVLGPKSKSMGGYPPPY
jgi:hypothetical protein